jgi:CheY-like chemotaxis protein
LTSFSLKELLNEITEIHKQEAELKEIEFLTDFEGNINTILIGDPLRLKQILFNLIGNSLKFTQNGYIKISVGVSEPVNHQVWLNMIVEDSGIGIEKEKLDLIFDEYVQVNQSVKQKSGGTGLGLAIVKKLVEIQGGNISVESEIGEGTRFLIEIPYKISESAAVNLQLDPIYEIPAFITELFVLIADDEEYNRFLIKSIFEKWKVRYSEVSNGEEAVHSSLRNNYDFILLDINMPGNNGFEVAEKILAEKPASKIIAITAATNQDIIKKSMEAGMIGFLAKPFTSGELLELLSINFQPEKRNNTKNQNVDLNFDELKRLANSDFAFMKEMLEIFMRSSENCIQTIENGFLVSNTEIIADSAHRLLSPSKHIHAHNLSIMLNDLEKRARSRNTEGMEDLITRIKKEIIAVNSYIREYLGNL